MQLHCHVFTGAIIAQFINSCNKTEDSAVYTKNAKFNVSLSVSSQLAAAKRLRVNSSLLFLLPL